MPADPKAASPSLQAASAPDAAALQPVAPPQGQGGLASQQPLPPAAMPPSLAASMPLATFVSKLSDHVKDYVAQQNFTEWSQIAF